MREYHFYVYIMASRSLTLYIGFTSNLQLRTNNTKAMKSTASPKPTGAIVLSTSSTFKTQPPQSLARNS